jgi:hypothetical protein
MPAMPATPMPLTRNRLGCRVSSVPGNHAGNSRFRGAIPAAHLCFGTLAAPPLWYPGFHLRLLHSSPRRIAGKRIITLLAPIVGTNLARKDSSGTAAGSALELQISDYFHPIVCRRVKSAGDPERAL